MDKNVTYDLKNIDKKIENANFIVSKTAMKMLGFKVKELNLDQIAKSKEATGARVKPYSKEYAERKGESKVTYVGKKSTYSKSQKKGGHMMAAFDVRSSIGKAEIGFFSKTARDKAKWNSEIRTFIGLSQKNYQKFWKWFYKTFYLKK